MGKFKLGETVMTRGIVDFIIENKNRYNEVALSLARHSNGDWGSLSNEDIELNNQGLETGDRLLSSYEVDGRKIWIITEGDRSSTTILFPEEY